MTTMREFFYASDAQQSVQSISFVPGLPQYVTDDYMKRYDELYAGEARQLERILHELLPGGTYDALLVALMERKRTMFRVTHVQVEHEEGCDCGKGNG